MSILALFLTSCLIHSVSSHGRLFQPPGRSSAWRYEFNTPKNYNDHEIYCGGYARQWSTNKGKCGPCGDPYDAPQPRDNENGGKYGRGVIVGKYKEGQVIEIGVHLTANHRGYFEFRLCPLNAPLKIPESNECFEKHLLQQSNGDGPKYYVGDGSKKFFTSYQLPKDLTCTQCVLQWRYVAGNNWGMCPNGTGKVGCGSQEEFRSCSDILITDEEGVADDTTHFATPPTQEIDSIHPDVPEHHQHSYGGHVAAIVVAISLAIIFALILLFTYLYTETRLRAAFRKPKGDWLARLPPSVMISSLKNTSLFSRFQKGNNPGFTPPRSQTQSPPVVVSAPPLTTVSTVPIAPPRRNRPSQATTVNGVRHTAISISSPVNVSINGVQVNQYPSNISPMDTQQQLHVPNPAPEC